MYKVVSQVKGNNFGFVYNSQESFKIMMMALSCPGKIYQLKNISLSEPDNDYSGILQSILTLMDTDTKIYISGEDPEIREGLILCFQQNNSFICRHIDQADFVLCLDGSLSGQFSELNSGTPDAPCNNTTIFYLVEDIDKYPICDGIRLDLISADLKSISTLYVDGIEEKEIEDWTVYRRNYPLGIDIFLISKEGRIAAISRSMILHVW